MKHIQLNCPACGKLITNVLADAVGKRGKCPKCSRRIVVSDRELEMLVLREDGHTELGLITNCEYNFATKMVKVNKELARQLFGSSSGVGNEVFSSCWLVSDVQPAVVYKYKGMLAALPAESSRRFYANSKLGNRAKVALEVPVALNLTSDGKFEVRCDLPCLEKPQIQPPERLPNSFVDSDLGSVLGTATGGHGLRVTNITPHDVMRYMIFDDDEQDSLQAEIRTRSPNAKFYASPSAMYENGPVSWVDNERRYEVKFDHSDDRVRIGEAWTLVEGYSRLALTQDPRIWRQIEIKWHENHA